MADLLVKMTVMYKIRERGEQKKRKEKACTLFVTVQ